MGDLVTLLFTKKKKKKDRKHKIKDSSIKVKIIDDDAQTKELDIDEELLLGGEDAPQIVGTYIEEKSNGESGNKWRSIAIKDEPEDEKPKKLQGPEDLWGKRAADILIKDEFSPPRRKETFGRNTSTSHRTKKGSSDDMSPPRRKQRDQSPPRNRGNYSREKSSKNVDSDESPSRRKTKESKEKTKNSPRFTDQSPPRKRHIPSEQSPERHKRKTSTDQTPPRSERNRSSDQSPTRRRKKTSKDQSPPIRRGRSPSNQPSVSHQNSRSSNNPFRMKLEKQSVDLSPQRRRNSDQSPPRRRKNSDQSPPRRSIRSRSPLATEIKREKDAPDVRSLTRQDGKRIRRTRWQKSTSRSPSPPPTHKPKMTKTLDGKHAGLQDAHALKSETNERRQKEEQFYAKMSDDISGRDAEVQMRKTGSGRLGRRARAARELDPEEQSRKEKHEKHKKELYDRWGKGLKQIAAHQAKTAEEQYEGSKPLARYTNDEDLERHLREQEHADDPMLEYMRQKKKEHQKHLNLPTVPIYQGSFPENRFSIRPGYRWDGVDRSNGYEKKWFDKQSEKLAVQDEAYKYSVEDM